MKSVNGMTSTKAFKLHSKYTDRRRKTSQTEFRHQGLPLAFLIFNRASSQSEAGRGQGWVQLFCDDLNSVDLSNYI